MLNKIQAKYRKWFENSEPREINQEHSTIRSHLSNFFRGSHHGLEFRPDSDLPDMIKNECTAGYDECERDWIYFSNNAYNGGHVNFYYNLFY